MQREEVMAALDELMDALEKRERSAVSCRAHRLSGKEWRVIDAYRKLRALVQ
jgi:hypothetical protein